MNAAQRRRYHAELWPAVCAAQGWHVKDDARRRETIAQCLIDIGHAAEDTLQASSTTLNEAQITALFCYLDHLAHPNHIGLLQKWDDCRANYTAYHQSRQADWWQRRAYGTKGGRTLVQRRFQGRDKAAAAPFTPGASDPLDPKAAADRLMTMRARAQRKGRRHQGRGHAPEAPIPAPGSATAPLIHQEDLLPPPPRPDPYACLNTALGYTPTDDTPF